MRFGLAGVDSMAWSVGVRSCGVGGARHVWPRLAGLGHLRLGPVLLGSTGRHLAGPGRAGPVGQGMASHGLDAEA